MTAIGSRMMVKICGITSVEDAALCVEAGADAIGLVFWPHSPRALSTKEARRIAKSLPPFISRVGVFVDQSRDFVAQIADEVGLDLVQFHGQETPAIVAAAPRRALKAVRVGPDFVLENAIRYRDSAAGLLLDAGTAEQPGGSGRTFDWSQAVAVRSHVRWMLLAGGLNADNVASAIQTVRPDGVDVSSGVEASPGRKDPEKVRAFIAAARSAQ